MTPRITIVTQWYPPEQAPFGRMMHELATFLARSAWDVTVITGFPNHPSGKVFEGFRKHWVREERIEGVRVCRVWLATSSKRTVFSRLMTFATFTVTASWRILRRPRPDVIFSVLQPLSVAITLPLLARLKRASLIFNLQDLHPDAQIRLGLVRNPLLIRGLRSIERHAYRSCRALTVISDPFRQHTIARGAAPERVFVIENWVDADRIRPLPQAGLAFRHEVGLREEDFVVLWAGTLGYVSGAAVVLEAARLLREDARVRFLVVGEGPIQPHLQHQAREARLTNMVFRPFQPESKLCAVQNSADVSLVTLAPGLSEVSVPSKVLAYLAAGKPVVASVPEESETARLIRRAGAGVIVPPGEPAQLAAAIGALMNDVESRRRLGCAARVYAEERLSVDAALNRYAAVFGQLRAAS